MRYYLLKWERAIVLQTKPLSAFPVFTASNGIKIKFGPPMISMTLGGNDIIVYLGGSRTAYILSHSDNTKRDVVFRKVQKAIKEWRAHVQIPSTTS